MSSHLVSVSSKPPTASNASRRTARLPVSRYGLPRKLFNTPEVAAGYQYRIRSSGNTSMTSPETASNCSRPFTSADSHPSCTKSSASQKPIAGQLVAAAPTLRACAAPLRSLESTIRTRGSPHESTTDRTPATTEGRVEFIESTTSRNDTPVCASTRATCSPRTASIDPTGMTTAASIALAATERRAWGSNRQHVGLLLA